MLAADLTMIRATGCQETGTIAFGSAHHLRSASLGNECIAQNADGCFAGASGLIISNFIVGTAGEVTDHLLGAIHLLWQAAPAIA